MVRIKNCISGCTTSPFWISTIFCQFVSLIVSKRFRPFESTLVSVFQVISRCAFHVENSYSDFAEKIDRFLFFERADLDCRDVPNLHPESQSLKCPSSAANIRKCFWCYHFGIPLLRDCRNYLS